MISSVIPQSREEREIFDPVVRLLSVDVMYDLRREKDAPDMRLHNETRSSDISQPISVRVFAG